MTVAELMVYLSRFDPSLPVTIDINLSEYIVELQPNAVEQGGHRFEPEKTLRFFA